MPDEMVYIDANELLADSFQLAKDIWNSGYRPDFLIGIWSGGTPPGIAMHEFFRFKGHEIHHTAIKAQSYQGMQTTGNVEIKGLEYMLEVVKEGDKVLIIDDVFDTGITMKAIIEEIMKAAKPLIRTATVYYKPTKRQVDIEPDFHLKINENWLVFPHELEELTPEQIKNKGERISSIILDP